MPRRSRRSSQLSVHVTTTGTYYVDVGGYDDGSAGTYTIDVQDLGSSANHFQSPMFSLAAFGTSASAGGWSSDNSYPRELADVNGDELADIVGFGTNGAYVALANCRLRHRRGCRGAGDRQWALCGTYSGACVVRRR